MTIRIVEIDDQLLHDAQRRLHEQSVRKTIEIALRVLAATPTQGPVQRKQWEGAARSDVPARRSRESGG